MSGIVIHVDDVALGAASQAHLGHRPVEAGIETLDVITHDRRQLAGEFPDLGVTIGAERRDLRRTARWRRSVDGGFEPGLNQGVWPYADEDAS